MQIKYEHCNLETLEGIERAEWLKEDGWTVCESSPFSVMMKKEDRCINDRCKKDKFIPNVWQTFNFNLMFHSYLGQ